MMSRSTAYRTARRLQEVLGDVSTVVLEEPEGGCIVLGTLLTGSEEGGRAACVYLAASPHYAQRLPDWETGTPIIDLH